MKCPHCNKEIEEKIFRLHWRSNEAQDIKGFDIADACRKAGIGGGALAALDYWEEVGKED